MHIAALSSCVSSLLNPFLLCQAFFFHTDHFFPSKKHFSSVLSTSRLFWALFGDTKHFWALLIILLCWEVFRLFQAFFSCAKHFFLLWQAFFGYAGHIWALPNIFLMLSVFLFSATLCIFLLNRVLHGIEEKCLEEPRSMHHSRKILRKGNKWSAWKKMLGRAEKGSA